MIRQKCIPLDSHVEWQEVLSGIKHAFAHTWENCYAMHLTTGFKTYLYCFETNNVRIVCPLAERRFEGHIDIVTPYGFSGFIGNGDYPSFPYCWENFVKQQDYVCGYIGLNPLLENSTYYDPHEAFEYNGIYVIDLTLDIEEIFNNLSTNRKRQLRHWDKINSTIVLDKNALINFFLSNYSSFFQRKKASSVYCFSRETLSFLLELDNVVIIGAGQADRIEAVTVFAYTTHMADFLFNVSLPEGQHHSASLLWYGLSYLKSLQVPLLNLGGGVHENDGVAQFKQRFGSKRLPLRSLKQVYKPKLYEELCRRANADPSDMTGYFPVYQKP